MYHKTECNKIIVKLSNNSVLYIAQQQVQNDISQKKQFEVECEKYKRDRNRISFKFKIDISIRNTIKKSTS